MRTAIWIAMAIGFSSLSYSQFLPDLQAKTPEEYDAYLDALDGPVIEKSVAFAKRFPDSQLRLPVYELMTRAWRGIGDGANALKSAEAGLAIAPDYIPLLVEAADLGANGTTNLSGAERAALRALELLGTAKAPKRVKPEDWVTATAALKARAQCALGLVKYKREDIAGAEKEFQKALTYNSSEGPSIHYRLGRLYAATGRKQDARQHLEVAAKSGEKALSELAKSALDGLN